MWREGRRALGACALLLALTGGFTELVALGESRGNRLAQRSGRVPAARPGACANQSRPALFECMHHGVLEQIWGAGGVLAEFGHTHLAARCQRRQRPPPPALRSPPNP